ncbi:MAG TPA: hypothetical protein PLB17_02940, partial [Comamonas denitrificans]|nr:hypothetical protein [Comamonas denitrificans]
MTGANAAAGVIFNRPSGLFFYALFLKIRVDKPVVCWRSTTALSTEKKFFSHLPTFRVPPPAVLTPGFDQA